MEKKISILLILRVVLKIFFLMKMIKIGLIMLLISMLINKMEYKVIKIALFIFL